MINLFIMGEGGGYRGADRNSPSQKSRRINYKLLSKSYDPVSGVVPGRKVLVFSIYVENCLLV